MTNLLINVRRFLKNIIEYCQIDNYWTIAENHRVNNPIKHKIALDNPAHCAIVHDMQKQNLI